MLFRSFIQLSVRLLRFGERLVENDLLWRYHFLRGSRFVVCEELVVGELEDSCFPDLTIDGAAVRAGFAFPGLRIDLLAYLSALEVVDIRPTKLLQKLSALWLSEQNSGASFTDFL